VFWLIKTKSAKQTTIWSLSTALTFAFIIFIFQNIFLGVALFASRQMTKGKVAKTYQTSFMTGVDHLKSNLNLYDQSTGQIINDRKLFDELYRPDLKQDDRIALPMQIGLFGIAFRAKPFDNKYIR
jgi:hypothetical protein